MSFASMMAATCDLRGNGCPASVQADVVARAAAAVSGDQAYAVLCDEISAWECSAPGRRAAVETFKALAVRSEAQQARIAELEALAALTEAGVSALLGEKR